jgi:branched-chain amino acid transport system substrate-binding protein
LSSDAVREDAASVEAAGLKAGYENVNLPLGGVNVTPVALQMKQAGVDGFVAATAPSTGLAIITALRSDGVKLRGAMGFSYGSDLTGAGGPAVQQSQGLYLQLPFEPVEMHTAATEKFQHYLRAVKEDPEPSFNGYGGYTAVDLFVKGLQQAHGNGSPQALIHGLASVKNWDATGLLGSHPFTLNRSIPSPSGPNNCLWFTQVHGPGFRLIPGAEPICGKLLSTPVPAS